MFTVKYKKLQRKIYRTVWYTSDVFACVVCEGERWKNKKNRKKARKQKREPTRKKNFLEEEICYYLLNLFFLCTVWRCGAKYIK